MENWDVNDVMPGSDGLGFFVILNKSSELRFGLRRSELIFRTWARLVQFVDCKVRTRVGWFRELRADDGRTVSIGKLCVSHLVSKNLNLKKVVFNWNHFEMRLLNLRINFYLLRTFCPHLGSFCVFSSFTTFRPNFTSGLLQVIFNATSDRNAESCGAIDNNYGRLQLLGIRLPRPQIGMLSLVVR